jgi:phage-related protein
MAFPIFIWNPSWGTAERSAPRTRNAELSQASSYASDGANADLKEWSVVFENRLHDEALAIDAFLAARGGVEAFELQNPRSLIKYYVCEQWDSVVVADRGNDNANTDKIWSITATFREVIE